jgi:hypothetical protein
MKRAARRPLEGHKGPGKAGKGKEASDRNPLPAAYPPLRTHPIHYNSCRSISCKNKRDTQTTRRHYLNDAARAQLRYHTKQPYLSRDNPLLLWPKAGSVRASGDEEQRVPQTRAKRGLQANIIKKEKEKPSLSGDPIA